MNRFMKHFDIQMKHFVEQLMKYKKPFIISIIVLLSLLALPFLILFSPFLIVLCLIFLPLLMVAALMLLIIKMCSKGKQKYVFVDVVMKDKGKKNAEKIS